MKAIDLLERNFAVLEKNYFLLVLKMISSNELLEFYDLSSNIELKFFLVENYIRRPDADTEIMREYSFNEKEEILRALWGKFYKKKQEIFNWEENLLLAYKEKKNHSEKIEMIEGYAMESEKAVNGILFIYQVEENSLTKLFILNILYNPNIKGLKDLEKIIKAYKEEKASYFVVMLLGIIRNKAEGLSQQELEFMRNEYGDNECLLNIWCGIMEKRSFRNPNLSFNSEILSQYNNNIY